MSQTRRNLLPERHRRLWRPFSLDWAAGGWGSSLPIPIEGEHPFGLMLNAVPVDRERQPCLDEQGRERGGRET